MRWDSQRILGPIFTGTFWISSCLFPILCLWDGLRFSTKNWKCTVGILEQMCSACVAGRILPAVKSSDRVRILKIYGRNCIFLVPVISNFCGHE